MFPDSKHTLTKKQLGSYGETLIAHYLIDQGFHILEHNYQTRSGEIDIIAQKNNLIAFVEVKTRTHHYFNLSQVITPSKQRSIIKTSEHYIARQKFDEHVFRFDIALVEGTESHASITFIPDAFRKPEEL
jgi:putative endonuclease